MNTGDEDFGNKVTILLIGVGLAALVVTIYHCLAIGWRNRDQVGRSSQQLNNSQTRESPSSFENSTAHLIPIFKYQKGMGLGGDDEETCAICLSEFEEGEELRTLPECKHSYHMACIDMWLYSHSNCPVCRTDALSPEPAFRTMNSEGSNAYQDLRMLPNGFV
ncbi:hypothetical protein P3X46_025532 [Hevea brasiliensis]|uniref:RING-type domain-containing protein n=2 Tax=Hevea brasiliensis TaxID=3981 RepID=A0ABQ9L8K8_HEVBR|nr:hypothetical protein P3X46_025532 [Hevea brasiliensis]